MVQKAASEEQPNVGLMVAVKKAADTPNGVIQVFAPLGTFLLEGVGIKVDEVEFPKLPFFWCTQITCAAQGPISNDLMSKMLNGKNLLMTIYVNPGEGLRHIFALDGFKDGYNALPQWKPKACAACFTQHLSWEELQRLADLIGPAAESGATPTTPHLSEEPSDLSLGSDGPEVGVATAAD